MTDIIGSKSSDEELIAAYKDGDIRGYNEIVKRYQQQVYWVIRKMVNTHDDADDITQEVFIKIYTALKDFREEANLFTWLYRIAVNYSLNHLNKAKVKTTVSMETVLEPIEYESSKADEQLDEDRKRKLVFEAINTLPPQQKAVFNFRYYDELPYEDIAKIMKLSVGGAKSNYFHAVKKIGEYVKRKM
jgi:RNA polymerase sigma-70 factor (ECF subfamily)